MITRRLYQVSNESVNTGSDKIVVLCRITNKKRKLLHFHYLRVKFLHDIKGQLFGLPIRVD